MPWLPVAVPPVPSPIFPERIGQPECAVSLLFLPYFIGPFFPLVLMCFLAFSVLLENWNV